MKKKTTGNGFSAHSFDRLPASVSTYVIFLGGLVQQGISASVLEASTALAGFANFYLTQLCVKIVC